MVRMQRLGAPNTRASVTRFFAGLQPKGASQTPQARHFASEPSSSDHLEERLQRIRELAKARYAKKSGDPDENVAAGRSAKVDEGGRNFQKQSGEKGDKSGEKDWRRGKIVSYSEFRGRKKTERQTAEEGERSSFVREPVNRGPVDGKKFADWGKDKYKLPLRDSSGCLLGKNSREKILKAREKRKAAQPDFEKVPKAKIVKPKKTPRFVKKEKDSPARSSAVSEEHVPSYVDQVALDEEAKNCSQGLAAYETESEEEESEESEEEQLDSPGPSLSRTNASGTSDLANLALKSLESERYETQDAPATPAFKATDSPATNDLLNFALKSLKSLENENGVLKESLVEELTASLPDVKVEGWKVSMRDRVERALAEKGLVSEASEAQVTQSPEPKTTATAEVQKRPQWMIDLDEETDVEEEKELQGTEVDEECSAENVSDADEEEEQDDVVEQFNEEANTAGRSKQPGAAQARALIDAVEDRTDEVGALREGEQKSVKVGIIGAPNAGKSSLLNFMVGTKVSAVSRKTNTTRNEILGILTENDTQILFYDTPGLMIGWKGQAVRRDIKSRVQSAWMVTDHCDVLMVLVDAHRQIERPDERVKRLVEKLGGKADPKQKRILCLNKVDLIKQKRELVPLAQQFGGLPGFDRVFMISGLRGGGVRHLKEYLIEKAVLRPWEEQKGVITDMSPVMAAKEAVWEHVLDNVHQEIPYHLFHKHVSWKVLKDRSIRIEQQLIVPTESQKKILIGKNGALIRKIGMGANEELTTRFGTKVHLVLDVRVAHTENLYADVENIPDEMFL